MKAPTVIMFALLAGTAFACTEEPTDFEARCSEEYRLAVGGSVGPTRFEYININAYQGRMGTTFFDLALEAGDTPHMVVFSTRGTEGGDIRSHLESRVSSGAENAATLDLATRPEGVSCDPSEGVVCAAYGVDVNNDGELWGINDVIYPVESGSITFTEVSGNELHATFDITFAGQNSGTDELRGDRGGDIYGCFRLFLSADVTNVW